MKKVYRIGVYPNTFGSAWHGGQIYFDNLIALLNDASDAPVELVVIAKERTPAQPQEERLGGGMAFLSDYLKEEKERIRREKEHARKLRKQKKRKRDQGGWWRGFLRTGPLDEAEEETSPPSPQEAEVAAFKAVVRDHQLDFVFPLPKTVSRAGIRGAAWIPDLQHCFLPELFTQADMNSRNEMFEAFAGAETVVFSSEASRRDFQKCYPEAPAQLEVWSFCSNPSKELFLTNPKAVVESYRLPERFFLVANQFWKHKDHAVVVDALVRLQKQGISVPVVFTGALRDYRGTGHVDELLQSIQRGGVHGSVHLLGFLDREEQLHLMRSALAVIQPSRFEGWSTVVEDCKALGQRLILSDLEVHREQDPPESVFFPVADSVVLAEKIRGLLAEGPAEWLASRESRESQAMARLLRTRAEARRRFLEIVERSQGAW